MGKLSRFFGSLARTTAAMVVMALLATIMTGVSVPASAATDTGIPVGGLVDRDGKGVGGVTVDLFTQADDGTRGSWVEDTTTDEYGRYRFSVGAGCWVLTVIAPAGSTFTNGRAFLNLDVCVTEGDKSDANDASLAGGGADAVLGGLIDRDGSGVGGVTVDLFTMLGDGTRGRFVEDTTTGDDGRYAFSLTAGCWVLTVIAPVGSTFDNGTGYQNIGRCVKSGEKSTDNDATLIGDTGGGDGVPFDGPDGVGIEIVSDDPITWNQIRIVPDARVGQSVSDVLASLPYDFVLDEEVTFESARLTIPYLDELVDGRDPAALRIHYFNDEYGLWVDAGPEQVVDQAAGTVSVNVDHLSRYAVLALDPEGFERYWPTKPVTCLSPDDGDAAGLDISFVIDTSGSMVTNDPGALRVEAALAVVDQAAARDRVAVVDFDESAVVLSPLTRLDSQANIDAVRASIALTSDAVGGTNITDAVRTGTSSLIGDPFAERPRVGILLTDGQSPYDAAATAEAAAADVVYYTVGLGPGVDAALLGSIASGTGGRYLPAPNADDLIAVYDEIAGGLVDNGVDTDGDGLSDCEETQGMYATSGFASQTPVIGTPVFNPRARRITTLADNADSDGDGLTDSAEMGPALDLRDNPAVAFSYRFLIDAGITRVYNPISDPNDPNSDDDDLGDLEEFDLGTNAFENDTDGDGIWDDDEVRAFEAGLDLDPLFYNDGPAGIDGIRADRLFVPIGFADLVWPAGVLTFDGDFRCSTGSGQDTDDVDCQRIVNFSQSDYANSGRFDAFGGLVNLYCLTFGSCGPADIEAAVIRSYVATQEFFTDEGSLRTSIVRQEALIACYEFANNGEQCSLERYQNIDILDSIDSSQELTELALDLLPGGRRPSDPEIESTKRRLEELCVDAKNAVPRGNKTPQQWGREVHNEFEDLILAEGNPRLFGETGYLNQGLANRVGSRWPRGTTAPDAVLGAGRLDPTALYDLKTGIKGIGEIWETRVRANLPPNLANVPVIEIRC